MSFTQYSSVAGTSLVGGGSTIVEEYIPLWVYSSGSSSGTTTSPSSSKFHLVKGTTSASVNAPKTLHILNPSWTSNQQFALEVSIWTTGGMTTYASIWDVTANSQVTESQVSTTATTATVTRSASLTLLPGHAYGVAYWNSSTSNGYITKAHLVALMM